MDACVFEVLLNQHGVTIVIVGDQNSDFGGVVSAHAWESPGDGLAGSSMVKQLPLPAVDVSVM